MTSRERVHATVKGLPVDRVPAFLWLNAHAGVKLMAGLRPSRNRHWNRIARFLWSRFEEGGGMEGPEIWRMAPLAFDIHMFNFTNAYSLERGGDLFMVAHATPWRYATFYVDEGRIRARDLFGVTRGIGGIYPDMIEPAVTDLDTLRRYEFPSALPGDLYRPFHKARETHPDASICVEIWGVQDFTATSLLGMERFLLFLYDYPEEMEVFLHRWADFQIEVIRRSVAAGADVVAIFDDYGYDNRTLLSMDMWKTFTYPQLRRLVTATHEAGALAMVHSCGFQMPFLPYYVDAGVDMLQSFQPKAGNDFEAAYGQYGDRLTFVTGIDVQMGEFMSTAELRADIVRNYRMGGRNGRHILGTTHEMQFTMPDENALAILDTIEDIGAGLYD